MKKILLYSALLLALCSSVYGYREFNRKIPSLKETVPGPLVDATALVGAFQEDEKAAAQQYVNGVIRVKGRVKKIESSAAGLTLYLIALDALSSVQCQMDSLYRQEASTVRVSDEVTIKGFVTGVLQDEIMGTDVKLTRCIIN